MKNINSRCHWYSENFKQICCILYYSFNNKKPITSYLQITLGNVKEWQGSWNSASGANSLTRTYFNKFFLMTCHMKDTIRTINLFTKIYRRSTANENISPSLKQMRYLCVVPLGIFNHNNETNEAMQIQYVIVVCLNF
jgi:hypothetical protein